MRRIKLRRRFRMEDNPAGRGCGFQNTYATNVEDSQIEQAKADIRSRLQRSAMLLAIIDHRRSETRDANLGAGLERYLLNRELNELEELPEETVAVSQGSPLRLRARTSSAVLLHRAGLWLRRKS